MNCLLRLLLVTLVATATSPAAAQFARGGGSDRLSVSLGWADGTAAAGSTAVVAVTLDIQERWHVQAGKGSGDEQEPYIATSLELTLPAGWTAGAIRWPASHSFAFGTGKFTETLRGYDGHPVLRVPVTIPAGAVGFHTIGASVRYQACDDQVCEFPTTSTTEAMLEVAAPGAPGAPGASGPPGPRPPSGAGPGDSLPATLRPKLPGLGGGGLFSSPGDEEPADAGRVAVELVWRGTLAPGDVSMLGVLLDVQEGWHIQAAAGGGDIGAPTTLALDLPEGWTSATVRWPAPKTFRMGEGDLAVEGAGYEGRVLAVVPLSIPADAAVGAHDVAARVDYQACDHQLCEFPTTARASIAAAVGTAPAALDPAVASLFDATLAAPAGAGTGTRVDVAADGAPIGALSFVGLLLAAMLGGFILNLTPCVLPVIPLKIMSLAHTAGNRARTLALGLAMSAGVVAFWIGLGLAIATVSGFTSANQLFQYPAFSITVGIVIAALAVGMCGLFSVQLPRFIYAINPSNETIFGSFAFGVMAAVLSTPCTAPFMGAAAAAAVGQSTGVVLTVFAAIGAGMALPYLVLSAMPRLVERMPRTGPASELIKQIMGLLMLAAAAYFVGVGVSGLLVTPPAPPSRAYFWVVAALIGTAAVWLAWRGLRVTVSAAARGAVAVLAVALLATAAYAGGRLSRPDDRGPIAWVYYTPERFDEALASGNVVVLEFTAEWCLNCKLLEKSVLQTERVADRLRSSGVVPMKVDLTGNNAAGNAKLNESGSVTIPWLVVYSPAGTPVFAQNWYTDEMLLEGIGVAQSSQLARSR